MIRNTEISNILEKLALTHEPLRLVNEYKGLPVTYEALVVEARPAEVVLKLHRYQAVCLQAEKMTFLETSAAAFQMKGLVDWVNFQNLTAGLSKIVYASSTIGDRQYVRVEPGSAIPVTLASRHRNFQGQLADVSMEGLGVYTLSALVYNPIYIKRGAAIQLSLELPGAGLLELPGSIQYISKHENTYRLGIKTLSTPEAMARLSNFIEQRRVELLAELEQAWQQASQQMPV